MALHFPVEVVPLYSFLFTSSRGAMATVTFLISPDHPKNVAVDASWIGHGETDADYEECRMVVKSIMEEAFGERSLRSYQEKVSATTSEAQYNMAHFMQTGKVPNGWDS